MIARAYAAAVLTIVVALTVNGSAQRGGKPAKGNPTPGTMQPEAPNLADRITLTGCVRMAPGRNAAAVDSNTPSDARFILTNAERLHIVPAGTGGSPLTADTASKAYRLQAIESQLAAFVDTKVELSGQVKPRAASSRGEGSNIPVVQVEFVQRVAAICG